MRVTDLSRAHTSDVNIFLGFERMPGPVSCGNSDHPLAVDVLAGGLKLEEISLLDGERSCSDGDYAAGKVDDSMKYRIVYAWCSLLPEDVQQVTAAAGAARQLKNTIKTVGSSCDVTYVLARLSGLQYGKFVVA